MAGKSDRPRQAPRVRWGWARDSGAPPPGRKPDRAPAQRAAEIAAGADDRSPISLHELDRRVSRASRGGPGVGGFYGRHGEEGGARYGTSAIGETRRKSR
jgi:hypothetical protein